jgi:ANTAR domain/GAF domain
MSAHTVASAFADAAAALVGEPDVADILAHLLADCVTVMDADAVAILARDATGELSLLAASSHRATELELLQIQRSAGPCVDVIESNEALAVSGTAQLEERWEHVGRAIADAGFTAVEAYPMRWRGTVLGGLNVFSSRPTSAAHTAGVGQTFADIATLAVIYSMPISAEQAATRLHEALNARELVEQAKGVIAYVDGVDMSTAYDTLLRRADLNGEPLTRTADDVIAEQLHRRRGP